MPGRHRPSGCPCLTNARSILHQDRALRWPGFALAEGGRGEGDAQREADRIMVSQFAPPGVLINAELQILQFRGATGAYLEPPTGKASFDLLKMARESDAPAARRDQ